MIRKTSCLMLLTALLSSPVFSADKIRILSSILPLQEFAAAVAGERGESELLLPPGAGVHTWQLRPGDVLRLGACDMFVFIGENLEPWAPDILKAVAGRTIEVLEAGHGLAVLEGGDHDDEHDSHDPHIWLDFGLAVRIVGRIEAALTRLDPSGKEDFRRNAEALRNRLRALDARFQKELEACRGKDLVVAGHGAFGYLARRYGLTQRAVYGMSPDSRPRPRQFMDLVDFCRKNGVRTVFFENSVPQDTARVLAAEIGGKILTLHPGHNLTEEQKRRGLGFFELMEENLMNLREGLSCR